MDNESNDGPAMFVQDAPEGETLTTEQRLDKLEALIANAYEIAVNHTAMLNDMMRVLGIRIIQGPTKDPTFEIAFPRVSGDQPGFLARAFMEIQTLKKSSESRIIRP